MGIYGTILYLEHKVNASAPDNIIVNTKLHNDIHILLNFNLFTVLTTNWQFVTALFSKLQYWMGSLHVDKACTCIQGVNYFMTGFLIVSFVDHYQENASTVIPCHYFINLSPPY